MDWKIEISALFEATLYKPMYNISEIMKIKR